LRAKFKEFKKFFENYNFEERRGFASIKKEEKEKEKFMEYKIERKILNGNKIIFKIEMEIEKGIEIISAKKEVKRVPIRNGRAPNLLNTGSHSFP